MVNPVNPANSKLVGAHQAAKKPYGTPDVKMAPGSGAQAGHELPAPPAGMQLPAQQLAQGSDAKATGAVRKALATVPTLTADAGPTGTWGWRQYVRSADDGYLTSLQTRQKKLVEWPSLGKESFARIYDERGMIAREPEDVSPFAADLVSSLQTLPAWPELRIAGASHYDVAGDASKDLLQGLADVLKLDAMPDDQGSPEVIRAELEALEGFRKRLQESDDPDDQAEALGGGLDDALEVCKRRLGRAQSRRQAASASVEKASQDGALSRLVAAVAAKAGDHAEAIEAARGFSSGGAGMTGGGAGGGEVNKALVDLLRRNKDLLEVIRMMGRMRQTAKSRVPDGEGKGSLLPDDIAVGDHLNRLLASEAAQLVDSDPDVADATLLRLLEKQTLERARKGREPRESGDLVVLLDRSGSMSGERWEWCRALGLSALLDAQSLAAGKRRRVFLCSFTDSGSEKMALVSPDDTANATASSEGGVGSGLASALAILADGVGGGTDTSAAIRRVAKNIAGRGLKDADWLVVTDGEWPPLSKVELNAIKGPPHGSRLFVVLLEGSAKIEGADRVWSIPHLSLDAAANILQEVALS